MRSLSLLGLVTAALLSACTMVPDAGKPTTDYPDASTPASLPENNGGIIDDITINGRGYNVMTDAGAMKVEKWQKGRTGFVTVWYRDRQDFRLTAPFGSSASTGYFKFTAIDKGVIFQFDTHAL